MLKGISAHLSPELLKTLAEMGHGDTMAIVDANFPAASTARTLHRCPCISSSEMLDAILSLFPLDTYVDNPAVTMQVVGEPEFVPPAVLDLSNVLHQHGAQTAATIERFAFYAEARGAFAIVQVGERRSYGNIILRKGVIQMVDNSGR